MPIQLSRAHIVILAENHNPTIATKEWLLSKRIVTEEPVDYVFVPSLSQYETDNFVLTVEMTRWQLQTKNPSVPNVERLPTIADSYVRSLPETRYRAMGLNFEWIVSFSDLSELMNKTKGIFVNPESNLAKLVDDRGLIVAGVVQYAYDDLIVQATAMPSRDRKPELRFTSNYHMRVDASADSAERVDQLVGVLGRYTAIYQDSEDMIHGILGDDDECAIDGAS